MARNISANLGANVTGVGYQFFDADGLIGVRQTAGITNPRPGVYYKAAANDTGAIGVYWNNNDDTVFASEVFQDTGTGSLTSEQATQLEGAYTNTLGLGAGSVTITSPVAEAGDDIELIQGDDYLEVDGRELAFAFSGGPSLIGATVVLQLEDGDEFTGEVLTSTTIQVELTATQTAALDVGPQRFKIEATLAGGSVVTMARGRLHVSESL
jgi:hypothetical protein